MTQSKYFARVPIRQKRRHEQLMTNFVDYVSLFQKIVYFCHLKKMKNLDQL